MCFEDASRLITLRLLFLLFLRAACLVVSCVRARFLLSLFYPALFYPFLAVLFAVRFDHWLAQYLNPNAQLSRPDICWSLLGSLGKFDGNADIDIEIMATAAAQRVFHWRGPSLTRSSLDKSLPARPKDHQLHISQHQTASPKSRHPSHMQHAVKKPREDPNFATVLIGPGKRRFKVDKKLLCACSPFFRERLEAPVDHSARPRSISLWLPGELPSMFALFVEWLHSPRHTFRRKLDDAVAIAQDQAGPQGLNDIHWAMIRLHLFASHLGLFHLQDSAMDAIQDLYLKCDWDVTPGLVNYLYTKCEALPAVRLRRWAVAMVAFSLTGSGGSDASSPIRLHPGEDQWDAEAEEEDTDQAARFQRLIDSLSELKDDYEVHMMKMSSSGLDARFKNPQLRIPANKLRNEERAFGFRECSFHSHRATVGEKRCPHERKRIRSIAAEKHAREHDVLLQQLGGLTSSSRRTGDVEEDIIPRPLFAEEEREKALRHVRSISSTLK